jgi:hypothetical protein
MVNIDFGRTNSLPHSLTNEIIPMNNNLSIEMKHGFCLNKSNKTWFLLDPGLLTTVNPFQLHFHFPVGEFTEITFFIFFLFHFPLGEFTEITFFILSYSPHPRRTFTRFLEGRCLFFTLNELRRFPLARLNVTMFFTLLINGLFHSQYYHVVFGFYSQGICLARY